MSHSYCVKPLKLNHTVDERDEYSQDVCPSTITQISGMQSTPHLLGSELKSFVQRHQALRTFGEQTFADIYRDFSDRSDLFALCDADARLIVLHSSSEAVDDATHSLGLNHGTLLNESSCGSNAVTLALRYREAMISTRSDQGAAPFNSWSTVAVPILDTSLQLQACVAIFNSGEGSLGEKLLLAKFVARELARFYEPDAESVQDANLQAIDTSARANDPRVATGAALTSVPTADDRRRGDRRVPQQGDTPLQSDVKLTRRQKQVLVLFAQGKGYKEIARDIGITSYKTVEEHLDAVREKLQVSHRRECIQRAMSLGLI